MINYLSLDIKHLSVCYVGNIQKGEQLILPKDSLKSIDSFTTESLIRYFMESFKKDEFYNFWHSSNLQFNEVYKFCETIFSDEKKFTDTVRSLGKFLYEQANHPNIKGGEFYVVYFKNIQVGDLASDAIGLFKSEAKDTFLKVSHADDEFEISADIGTNIKHLDKGCLILNTAKKNGYKVLVVDNLNRSAEAQYWKKDFLNIKECSDDYHFTNNFLQVTKNFITQQLPKDFELSKTEQIAYLNKSVEYFKEKESFDINEFQNEVFTDRNLINSFQKFGSVYLQSNELDIAETFDISPQAVKKQSRIFKSVVKLDKNFHIYIHGNTELIVKGYDSKSGKQYYKIYFDEES